MNSVADIWKIVLSRLSQDLSETTISTWFDEVEAVSIKDRTLYLHCPNDFKRSTIESMFSDRIKDSLRDIYSADFDVKLLSTAESTALFEPEVKKSTALLDSGEFTFDTFVVGESNKMAYAAARAVAEAVRAGQQLRVRGFRVCIFSDNGPEARNGAFAAQKLFEETYPGVKVYMDYKIPYFVVSVGDCLSNEEAVILKGRVTGTFPKAFLKNEEFPISNLLD